MKRIIQPGKSLPKSVTIPSSKSHTIRALLIAAMADGTSTLINPLVSEDTASCVRAVEAFGARMEQSESVWTIRGNVKNFFKSSGLKEITIDAGNSGTTLYLAAGLAALLSRPVTFTGDDQIQSRPVGSLLNSLTDLGASVTYGKKKNYPPFTIQGPLKGGKTSIECPTSQYLSSLLLCTPLADGNTDIEIPLLREQPYVEMTLRWLDEQFVTYKNNNFKEFFIPGGQMYHPFTKQVPGDFSSATFFLCAAAITGRMITLEGLDIKDSQGDKEVIFMLEKMGCKIETEEDSVRIYGRPLKGCTLDLNNTPDALPALAAAACYAEGETRLINVPQARLKETDRISVMKEELSKMGADIRELSDGLIINGKKNRKRESFSRPLRGAEVSGHGDHRVIMALAIAALGAEGKTVIDDDRAVAITFPGFFELLQD